MKFEAAPITPGRAKTCQNGTEPSAKSTQSVPLSGMPPVSEAAARCGTAAKAAQAATAMRTRRFNPTRLSKKQGRKHSASRPSGVSVFVEPRVDFGNFFGLRRLVRLGLVVHVG